jgi:hypothetical protein
MKKLVEVILLREAGLIEALHGMSMSHGKHEGTMVEVVPGLQFPLLKILEIEAMVARAGKLAPMQGGHNKFLESVVLWLDVRAPRYWWQQADTYRIATKQSESTMHTATKRRLTQDDFVEPLPVGWIDELNRHVREKNLDRLKRLLPEGFMQRRVWMLSYKTFQNIWMQRRTHKLEEWRQFLHQVLRQIEHPEYITAVGPDGAVPEN